MSAEQYHDTTTWDNTYCTRCGQRGLHVCNPPQMVPDSSFSLGRVASALERIADALERRQRDGCR